MKIQSNAKSYTSGELLRRFLPYYKKYWKIVVIDLFCAGLTSDADDHPFHHECGDE